jgi:hypothetical protein
MRWDGSAVPHHETWHITLNQLNSGAGFWIRYSILAPRSGEAVAHVCFVSYVPDVVQANVALAQCYPIDQFQATADPFGFRMGPCGFQPDQLTGMMEVEGVPVAWDFEYHSVTDPLKNLPDGLYLARLSHYKIVTPHPFLSIAGRIQIRDHQFILNSDPGQQAHIWGKRYPREWNWFHCSAFVESGGAPVPAYVTGLSLRESLLGGILLPPLNLGHLVWQDHHMQLQTRTPWSARWQGPWEWAGTAGSEQVVVTVTIPWPDMVLAEFEEPHGRTACCHRTCRADCTVSFRARGRPPREFKSLGMAHLEIGSRSIDLRASRKVRCRT